MCQKRNAISLASLYAIMCNDSKSRRGRYYPLDCYTSDSLYGYNFAALSATISSERSSTFVRNVIYYHTRSSTSVHRGKPKSMRNFEKLTKQKSSDIRPKNSDYNSSPSKKRSNVLDKHIFPRRR